MNRLSSRVASLCLGLSFLVTIFGCLGGGGGGGGSGVGPALAPDAAAITQTVERFMRAMVSGKESEAQALLSPRLQMGGTTGSVVASITLWDFGADINNGTDDASWTFLIREGGINQSSESFATVTADGITPEGKLLQVGFALIKVQGVWYIDEITLIDVTGQTYDMPSFFPINPGDEWIYELAPLAGQAGITRIRRVIGSQTEIIGGKQVFTVFETTETINTPAAGIRYAPRSGIRALFDATWTRKRFSNTGGVFFYGPDIGFNNNVPLQVLAGRAKPGDVSTQTITLTANGKAGTADVQIRILPEETMATRVKTLQVLPIELFVTYREPSLFSYTREREIWYLAMGIGIVSFQVFDPADPSKPLYQTQFLEGKIGGTSFLSTSELATPTIALVFPTEGSVGVSTGTAIYADFSKLLHSPASPSWITVLASGQAVVGSATVSGLRLSFKPAGGLPEGTEISVTVASDVLDSRGMVLGKPRSWKFTTGAPSTSPNTAPSFAKGSDLTVLEDAGTISLAAWATAIAAGPGTEVSQTVTFRTRTDQAAWFAVLPAVSASGTLTFTPAPNANGRATIEISLQDNGGTSTGGTDVSATQTFVITIQPVNDAPVFVKGPDQAVNFAEGAKTVASWAMGITPGPVDEAVQKLEFLVLAQNPALFTVQPAVTATGALTFAPAGPGTTVVSVQLRDDGGIASGGVNLSASQTFQITIAMSNQAPVFTKGANIAMTPNEGWKVLPNWATGISTGHPAEAAQKLTFRVAVDNPQLFASAPVILPDGTLQFLPFGIGTVNVEVSLKDDGGTAGGGVDTSASQTFTITLNPAPSTSITWRQTWPMDRTFAQTAVIGSKVFVVGGAEWNGSTFDGTYTLQEYDSLTNSWTVKASIPNFHSGYGVTSLNDKIYLVGGSSDGGTDLCEYDPSTNAWTELGYGLNQPRTNLSAIAFNGKIYAIGGMVSGSVADVEVFDPLNPGWVVAPSLNNPRELHATLVVNGQIFVFGGMSGISPVTNSEVFNGTTWTTLPIGISDGRKNFAYGVYNNAVYIAGGEDSGGFAVDSTAVLTSLDAPGWNLLPPLGYGRIGCTGGFVNGRFLTINGATSIGDGMAETTDVVEEFDPAENTWFFKTFPAPIGRPGAAGYNGQVYFFGGFDYLLAIAYSPTTHRWLSLAEMPVGGPQSLAGAYGNRLYTFSAATLEYDPAGNSWQERTPIPGITGLMAGGLIGGRFFAAGGVDSMSYPTNALNIFDPATNLWTTGAPLPTTQSGHAAATINDRLLVFGSDAGAMNVYEYNPVANFWTTKAQGPAPLSYATAVECGGKIFLLGGQGTEMATNLAVAYDPFTDTWVDQAPFTTARYNAAATVVGGEIFLLGGEDGANQYGHLEIGTVSGGVTVPASPPGGGMLVR